MRRAAVKSIMPDPREGLKVRDSCGKEPEKASSRRDFAERRVVPRKVLLYSGRGWPRGGVVTQRTANPRTPVQFRAWPPPASAKAAAGETSRGGCAPKPTG